MNEVITYIIVMYKWCISTGSISYSFYDKDAAKAFDSTEWNLLFSTLAKQVNYIDIWHNILKYLYMR